MNRVLFFWLLLLSFFINGSVGTSYAGEWTLKGYSVARHSHDEFYRYNHNRVEIADSVEGPRRYGPEIPPPGTQYFVRPAASWSGEMGIETGAHLTIHGYNSSVGAGGSAWSKVSVFPIFEWQGDDEPTDTVYYVELCHVAARRTHKVEEPGYTFENKETNQPARLYNGSHIAISTTNSWNYDFSETFHGNRYGGGYASPSMIDRYTQRWNWHRIKASGRTAYGPTRTLQVNVVGKGVELGNSDFVSAGAFVSYRAEVCRFLFDVSASGEIQRHLDHPRDKDLDAYASKNILGQTNPEAPIEFFWDGPAGYNANLSSSLLNALGTPTYDWDVTRKTPLTSGHLTYGRDTGLWPNEIFNRAILNVPDNEWVWKDTPTKSFHHDLNNSDQLDNSNHVQGRKVQNWPETTVTKVKITGSNEQRSVLTAKAKINWYENPNTLYRSESVFEIIDLETGEITSLASELDGEEDQIDEYIAEINDAKNQTFETGKALVSAALETQMAVGSWYVPDAIDVVTVGGGKLVKAVKAAKVLSKVVGAVNKVGGSALDAVKRSRAARGLHQNVVLRVRNVAAEGGRLGKLPPNAQRLDDLPAEKTAKKTCWFGQFCFVAGTPVVMSDGQLKPIEQIKTGDVVLSKDEATGEVAAKKVTQTFARQAPATIALTFSNGERIETTDEHPFYTQTEGFKPAGLLAIGHSIVTRAGPALAVIAIEKKKTPQTVYNFSVEDFHTYFVGKSALWVHNTECPTAEVVLGRPFRGINSQFPPEVSVLNKFNSINQTPGYCTDFAESLFDVSNSSNKSIVRIVNERGANNVYTFENGRVVGYTYHDVFMDGQYVYDKLLSSNPVPLGDWQRYMSRINPGAQFMHRPRNARWDYGFDPR